VFAIERFRPDVLVGHSAGGHLALLAAKKTRTPVVAIAAVSDPHTWDNPGVKAFFHGDPPDAGSPLRELPLGVPAVLVHGTRDDTVPFEHSQRFVAAAGADVRLVVLEGAGHFEPVDPQSPEWTAVRDAVDFLCGRSSSS
jgi:alpha-beta hydrolase superfamily lysophospholipase